MADELNKNVPNEATQAENAVKDKIESFLGSPALPVEDKKAEETPKNELPKTETTTDKTVTPPSATQIPEPAKAEEKIIIDPVKIATDAKDAAIEEIRSKYNLTEKQAESYWKWEKEGRNPSSYQEMAENIKEVVKREVKADQEAEKKRIDDEAAQAKLTQDDRLNTQNKIWDTQQEALIKSGKLTSDKEVITDFWKQIVDYNKKLVADNQPPLSNLIEFYTLHFKPTVKKQPAGGDVPIIGKNTNVAKSSEGEYSHADIRGAKSLYDLVPRR